MIMSITLTYISITHENAAGSANLQPNIQNN